MTVIIIIYLFVINLIAFVLYGVDKNRAKHSQWRISEKTLLDSWNWIDSRVDWGVSAYGSFRLKQHTGIWNLGCRLFFSFYDSFCWNVDTIY